jgi:hypothetical protein
MTAVTSPLNYNSAVLIITVVRIISQAPGVNFIKLFWVVSDEFS